MTHDSDAPARLIRSGDTGPAVRDVQERLARLGAGSPVVDGQFGHATLLAVRRFQQQRGLPADGIVGPETWRALVEAGFALGDRLLWQSRVPMRGDDVRELQRRLNQLGFDAGAEDGIFGRLARSAAEEFQRNIGLTVDGVVGPRTIEALRRLRRDHHAPGAGVRAREREALRRLSGRGLPGARILIDPAHGPHDPGERGFGGIIEADVVMAIATRTAARLAARGAEALLSRGPHTTPSPSDRARLANELGVDVVLSIGLNALDVAHAQGSSTYYFGTDRFISEAGRTLAELVQDEVVGAGWAPDCRIHPMTWGILRETRMPAVVVEPAFITCPQDAERLCDPGSQDELAGALTSGIARFFDAAAEMPAASVGVPVVQS